jgi:hypothetical protein
VKALFVRIDAWLDDGPLGGPIRWLRRHRPKNIARLVMPYLVIVMTGLLIISLIQTKEARDYSTELRNGLVASCERNGNTVRAVLQKRIEREIENGERFNYSEFFPNVPPDVLAELIKEQREESRKELKEIEPVDCAAQYP